MSDTVLDGAAVEAVAKLAQQAATAQVLPFGKYQFTNQHLHRVSTDRALPDALEFTTLQGLADVLGHGQPATEAFVHVVSPVEVHVRGLLEGVDLSQRATYASATVDTRLRGWRFDTPGSLEGLAIALQTCFAPTGQVEALRKFCASVRSQNELGVADDGVSQSVQAKRGIAAVQATAVSNPWLLAPYRTFPEVEQPLSPYVLRFQQDDGEIVAGLWETGDASWRAQAVKNICAWFREHTDRPVLG